MTDARPQWRSQTWCAPAAAFPDADAPLVRALGGVPNWSLFLGVVGAAPRLVGLRPCSCRFNSARGVVPTALQVKQG